jgi:outer membrane receptor protein involved in Fe transport
VRIPITSPTWNFWGFYSFEVDFAEREEWYSQNTTNQLDGTQFHTRYNAQKPKISVRWQPLDPKWIGAVTLRASYAEAFHAPTLSELTPAGGEAFENIHDPKNLTTENQVEAIVGGNPLLKPETAYEWDYGIVYSPKWIRGLTLSADWYHIDLRTIATSLGAQFILDNENSLGQFVIRDPTTGEIKRIFDTVINAAGAVVEGLDYEAIYILDSSIFNHGDFGRFTFTANGTYNARFQFQASPESKPVGLNGQFIATSFTFTGSLPQNRAYFSMFWDGR